MKNNFNIPPNNDYYYPLAEQQVHIFGQSVSGSRPNDQCSKAATSNTYTADFLSGNIGNLMKVEFLVGDTINDKVGVLKEVGASYIVLQSVDPSSIIMCDLHSIKFATIITEPLNRPYTEV